MEESRIVGHGGVGNGRKGNTRRRYRESRRMVWKHNFIMDYRVGNLSGVVLLWRDWGQELGEQKFFFLPLASAYPSLRD